MSNEMSIYQQQQPAEMVARGTQTDMMVSREAQRIQAAVWVAHQFPRNTLECYGRIMDACKRKSLAEVAVYEYPRGGQKVTGPSIRLAEVLAQNWWHMECGSEYIEQTAEYTTVRVFAIDYETNYQQSKIFTVQHVRHTKNGDYPLTDPRDIYELVANQSARRLRACILAVIPGDIVDAAIAQCDKTLAGDGKEPLADRIRKMTQTFKDEYGVTIAMLEKYIGWKSESFTDKDLIKLGRVYISIRDGMARKEEVFDMNVSADDGQPIDAFEAAKEQKQPSKNTGSKSAKERPAKSTQAQQEAPQPAPAEDDFAAFESQFENGEQLELPFK